MDFLMDYLPAIQFVAALNIGYIIPNVLQKMYGVLENINLSYEDILKEVKNKAIVKHSEVCNIHVVQTTDLQTTQGTIDELKEKLNEISSDCEKKDGEVKSIIADFIGCRGYRSLFFYSALYAMSTLIIIPFCYQHADEWIFRNFFYFFTVSSLAFVLILFCHVLLKKSDVSCWKILRIFMLMLIISAIVSFVNSFLPCIIIVTKVAEDIMSWMAIIVSFLPCVGCLFFLTGLIWYSINVAKKYAKKAKVQFDKINKQVVRLDDFNKLLNGNVTLTDINN